MSRESDLRYSPLCKDLKDVVHFSVREGGKELLIKCLDNYIGYAGDEESNS